LLRPHLPRVIKAWVDGLKATVIAYDRTQQKMVDTGLPDHKERRKSGRAISEYLIGKAIERSMEVTGSYKELSVLLDELRASPEAQRLLGTGFFDSLLSGQSTAEGKDDAPTPENETKPDPEQKQVDKSR
jgi:hypothetical protein